MVYLAITRGRYAAVAFGRDDRLDARWGELGTDGKGYIAFAGGQRLDAAGQHPEQRAKALNVRASALASARAATLFLPSFPAGQADTAAPLQAALPGLPCTIE